MAMTISIDDSLKEAFSATCGEIGLTPSAAFAIFAKAVVRENRIPFDVSAISEEERALRVREQAMARGIWEGYCDFEEGRTLTREESRTLRESRKETR